MPDISVNTSCAAGSGDRFAPLPRCCDAHDSWTTLAQHVVESFPEAPLSDIARELRLAKDVIEMFNLGDDALETADLIARHRLMLATGAVGDVAKLDPQPHNRRGRVAAPADSADAG